MSGPDLTDAEVAAVVYVLRRGRLSLGPLGPRFEARFAEYVGARHAIAVSSGTAALHLAVLAARVGEGDYVITSPFSFVASANCILYERAVPIFVDVDPETGNLEPAAVAAMLDALARRDRDALPRRLREAGCQGAVRAVLPVHLFGRPVDMPSLLAAARRPGISVIEDACEAVGARWNGRHAGTFGETGCFGFYPNKQMTTGEGGVIVTDDDEIAERCRARRNQGRDAGGDGAAVELGYNYRLPEMACAIGLVQLQRIDELLEKRERVAGWYTERLAGADGIAGPPPAAAGARLSWFAYLVRFESPRRREEARARLGAAGIPSRVYFRTIPSEPYYAERFGYRPGDFPHAERLSETSLALPFSGVMTEKAVDRVCAALRGA